MTASTICDPIRDFRTWSGVWDSDRTQAFTSPRETALKMSHFRYRFVAFISLFISFSTANALEVTGRIKGTVTDT
jgi:hypothetical protein